MSTFKIRVANFFAKNSCPAWQPVGFIRRISRIIYRSIMENDISANYRYPYAEPEFANWPESDDGRNYTLISDSAGFVIRHSPSYCAWRIKRRTGKWPKRPTPGKRAPGEHAFDAKHWDELLEFNGWQRRESGPTPFDDTKFIGIIKDEGEFGQLVWLETYITYYAVSTYANFRMETRTFLPSETPDIIWYAEPGAKEPSHSVF